MQVKLTVNNFWRPLRMVSAAKSLIALLCRMPLPQRRMFLGAVQPSPQFPCSMHCEHPLLPAFKGVFLVCINGHVTRLLQELAHEKSEVCLERRSFVGVLKLSLQRRLC